MRTLPLVIRSGAALAVLCGSAGVVEAPVLAASTPTPASTAPSITAPLEERNGSGRRGSVTLSPQGNKTMVSVSVSNAPTTPRSVTIHSGKDCQDLMVSSAGAIPLQPLSGGQVSRTIVSVPIQSFKSSNFVVAVRDATARQQSLEACARMGP